MLNLQHLALHMSGHEIQALEPRDDRVVLGVDTPEGRGEVGVGWLVACGGARSPRRQPMRPVDEGVGFRSRLPSAETRMQAQCSTARRFWFDPPFRPNASVERRATGAAS